MSLQQEILIEARGWARAHVLRIRGARPSEFERGVEFARCLFIRAVGERATRAMRANLARAMREARKNPNPNPTQKP